MARLGGAGQGKAWQGEAKLLTINQEEVLMSMKKRTEEIMDVDFSDQVAELGVKSLKIMNEYFEGKEEDTEKIKYASKTISQTITAQNMKRVGQYQERSLALRLLKYLPTDEDFRRKYIEVTNPQIKPLMLAMPAMK